MKYSLEYYRLAKTVPPEVAAIDELILELNDGNLNSLNNYIEEIKDRHKRIVLNVAENFSEKNFSYLNLIHSCYCDKVDIALRINYDLKRFEIYKSLTKIPIFMNFYCSTREEIANFLSLGVSDIYLFGEICFEIETYAEIIHNNNVKVRVIPNTLQSRMGGEKNLKKFFIRPIDVKYYEGLIDYMEFVAPSLDKKMKMYKLYKQGDELVPEVIDNMLFELGLINGQHLPPDFARRRLNCGKKCLFSNECNNCIDF